MRFFSWLFTAFLIAGYIPAQAKPAQFKQLQTIDYLWICRYNVGTAKLTPKRLRACMNYSRKIMLAKQEIRARMDKGR